MKHKIGIELEMENKNKYYCWEDSYNAVNDVFDTDVKYFDKWGIEDDCSLDDTGIEVQTPIYTRDDIVSDKFQTTLENFIEKGFVSHDTKNCGLHMHFDLDTYFGDNKLERNTAIAKIAYLFSNFYTVLFKLSRRSNKASDYYFRNIGFNMSTDTAEEIFESSIIMSDYGYNLNDYIDCGGKGSWFMHDIYDTIEFRIARGTLNHTTIVATMDLYLHIIHKAQTLKWNEVSDIKKWFGDVPENVQEYFIKRKVSI